jgi:Xaa-Pro aminopeptidase
MNMIDRFAGTPGFADARRIGFDGLSPFFEGLLRTLVPNAEFVGCEDMMREIRRRKLPAEIVCLRTAAAIAESSLYAAVAEARPGVTERHLQATFLDRMCELGTSQFARQGTFSVVDPGAPLRWTTSSRVLDDGCLVACAGGVLWAGYEGSLARTWWCGDRNRPTSAARALHDRCRAVIDGVVDRCRPGSTGADLRAAYAQSGEPEPGMSIAYAIGLGHEGPLAGPGMSAELERAQVLEPDMVLGVRAFVGSPDGGCYAEDMVLVTDAGPELLTTLGPGPLAG